MKVSQILALIFGVLSLTLIVVISNKNSKIDDCISEIDAFHEYYNNAEAVIATPDSTIGYTDIWQKYDNAKTQVIDTYNYNHPNEIPLNKKVVDR